MLQENLLGAYLKDRRSRLDPAAFGFSGRRRTPGLRREEVAQRSNISPTWYTWLEQGRGGAPSADVLNRIAGGLMLPSPSANTCSCWGSGARPRCAIGVSRACHPVSSVCSTPSRSALR